MRKLFVSLNLVAVSAVLCGLLLAGPTVLAVSNNSGQPAAQAQEPQGQEQSKTFMGKIAKDSNGELVLKEGYPSEKPDSKATYKLDDQEKAKQYVGKSVKVTGTLDSATNTIHVASIEEGTT